MSLADQLQASARAAAKAALERTMKEALRLARAALGPGGGGPRGQSGALARSLKVSVRETADGLVGTLSSDSPYARVHESGAVIQAQKAAYLKFRVGGQWVSVKQVRIPARPFMAPSLERAAERFPEIFNQMLEEELS